MHRLAVTRVVAVGAVEGADHWASYMSHPPGAACSWLQLAEAPAPVDK